MFNRQVVQMVSLDDLARFIKQVAPQQQQPPQTTITIYIGELHIHQADAGYQRLPAGQGRMALQAPGSVAWPDLKEDGGACLDYIDRALGALVERR